MITYTNFICLAILSFFLWIHFTSKGVSPLSMNDITSGFNIRHDIILLLKYEHMCGLKEKDIQRALEFVFAKKGITGKEKQDAVNIHLNQMREYYNGYKFGTIGTDRIYNTNLCLDYL
jgi:hypothetical protein